jgi:hypothetical protein
MVHFPASESSPMSKYRYESESATLRHLPAIFVLINVTMTVPLLCYAIIALARGVTFGDVAWPYLLVAIVNFPSSLVGFAWEALLDDYWKGFSSATADDMVYSFFQLLCGVIWYYVLGRLLRSYIRRHRDSRDEQQGFPVIPSKKRNRKL